METEKFNLTNLHAVHRRKMNGEFLKAFNRTTVNVDELLYLARDLPSSTKYSLVELAAKWDQCRNKISPLSAAIIAGMYEVTELLVKDGAPLVQTFKGQYHPLSLALFYKHTRIAEFLIDSGANVRIIEFDGTISIFWAIHERHPLKIVEKILAAGLPVDSISMEKLMFRPIHSAVMENDLGIVTLLVKHSADVNIVTAQNETPLNIAVKLSLFDIVKLLVKHGADLVNKYGSISPLLLAITHKNHKMVNTLLDLGADIEIGWVGTMFNSPLIYAINFALDDELVKLLLSRGANVSPKYESSGETALHAISDEILVDPTRFDLSRNSLKSYQVKTAKIILSHGADLDAKDADGLTPLHVAILHRNEHMCTLLMTEGAKLADVKCFTNDDGSSIIPFECVVCYESLATPLLIKLCLEQGADYNHRNRYGITMYHCAKKHNNEQIIKYFWQYGCPYDQEIDMFWKANSHLWQKSNSKIKELLEIQSSFILGIKKGLLKAVVKAIKNGAEPKGCSLAIPSTLHYVASRGHDDLARLLLEEGVPVNRTNGEGVTALHLAVQGGHVKTCEVLLEFGACYCERGVGKLVKSYQQLSTLFNNIYKCFKLVRQGRSVREVMCHGESVTDCVINCVNRQGLTLTALAISLGHSHLAAEIMALRLGNTTTTD